MGLPDYFKDSVSILCLLLSFLKINTDLGSAVSLFSLFIENEKEKDPSEVPVLADSIPYYSQIEVFRSIKNIAEVFSAILTILKYQQRYLMHMNNVAKQLLMQINFMLDRVKVQVELKHAKVEDTVQTTTRFTLLSQHLSCASSYLSLLESLGTYFMKDTTESMTFSQFMTLKKERFPFSSIDLLISLVKDPLKNFESLFHAIDDIIMKKYLNDMENNDITEYLPDEIFLSKHHRYHSKLPSVFQSLLNTLQIPGDTDQCTQLDSILKPPSGTSMVMPIDPRLSVSTTTNVRNSQPTAYSPPLPPTIPQLPYTSQPIPQQYGLPVPVPYMTNLPPPPPLPSFQPTMAPPVSPYMTNLPSPQPVMPTQVQPSISDQDKRLRSIVLKLLDVEDSNDDTALYNSIKEKLSDRWNYLIENFINIILRQTNKFYHLAILFNRKESDLQMIFFQSDEEAIVSKLEELLSMS